MSNIWFTSDLHLGHDKDFLYQPRGFQNIWEHNYTIVSNWNAVVGDEDDVYVLGDLMLGKDEGLSYIHQLRGQLHVICGNHDTTRRRAQYEESYNIVEVVDAKFLRIGHYHFFLSHYPTLCSNFDVSKPLKARMINLCGHLHTQNPFSDWDKGLIYHVELDAHGNRPVEYEEIMKDIRLQLGES